MELEGQIEEFIYQNESNDYSIAVFMTTEDELLTVVRIFAVCSSWGLFEIIWKNGCSSRIW